MIQKTSIRLAKLWGIGLDAIFIFIVLTRLYVVIVIRLAMFALGGFVWLIPERGKK